MPTEIKVNFRISASNNHFTTSVAEAPIGDRDLIYLTDPYITDSFSEIEPAYLDFHLGSTSDAPVSLEDAIFHLNEFEPSQDPFLQIDSTFDAPAGLENIIHKRKFELWQGDSTDPSSQVDSTSDAPVSLDDITQFEPWQGNSLMTCNFFEEPLMFIYKIVQI
ncbi:9037_t:CDS:2 [Ambispora leptoticha]|uniref:9037_t:CDS:1 n=1 Tax=Ambispora leptoticha TaxID=144679 RepID=A0A9N9A5N4_9GLOM|nr:9037_t:CDS:2 [Ambispora leptoticha]